MIKDQLERGWQKNKICQMPSNYLTLLYFQLSWMITKDDHDFSWSICEQWDIYKTSPCLYYFSYFLIFCLENRNFSIQFSRFLQSIGNFIIWRQNGYSIVHNRTMKSKSCQISFYNRVQQLFSPCFCSQNCELYGITN